MAQTDTKTMTESLVDQAGKFGDGLMHAGTNVFHAGVGVIAATEEQLRESFGQMVDRGRRYGEDDSKLFSRATREARELGRQLEGRVEKLVTATLNRAGMPGRDEIERLGRRVEALTHKVEELAARQFAGKEGRP